jgi:hypothetical protein
MLASAGDSAHQASCKRNSRNGDGQSAEKLSAFLEAKMGKHFLPRGEASSLAQRAGIANVLNAIALRVGLVKARTELWLQLQNTWAVSSAAGV